METIEIMRYVIEHSHEQTQGEMASACGISRPRVSQICTKFGIIAVDKGERTIAALKKGEGVKTLPEMISELGLCAIHVRKLCREYGIWLLGQPQPLKPVKRLRPLVFRKINMIEKSAAEEEKIRRQKESKKYLDEMMAKGFSKMEVVEILEATVEAFDLMAEKLENSEGRILKQRPPAIYDNESRYDLCERILSGPTP